MDVKAQTESSHKKLTEKITGSMTNVGRTFPTATQRPETGKSPSLKFFVWYNRLEALLVTLIFF